MFKRLIPLAALAASACVAAVPPPGSSPSPGAGATASPATTATATPAPAKTAAPTATPTAKPTASPAAAMDAEACEHLSAATGKPARANLVSMSRERATVNDDHARYDVELVANAGKYEGYVLFNSDEAGDYHFFLNKDVPFKLIQDGKTVAFEEQTKASATCPAIKAAYVAGLGVGQVELHFGPASETSVGVLIEHMEDGHEHNK